MSKKGNTKGRYMEKVGIYDIYAKDSYRPKKEGSKKYDKPEVNSTVYNIYHSKKLIEGGFKTKELALDKANILYKKK